MIKSAPAWRPTINLVHMATEQRGELEVRKVLFAQSCIPKLIPNTHKKSAMAAWRLVV